MKNTHSVECKLVVAKTVVHFSTHCQELFHHIKNRLALDFVTVVAEIILSVVEICPLAMLFIMLALCFMLFIPYYAKNYAGI